MLLARAALCALSGLGVGETPELDELLAAFWQAPTAEARTACAAAIVRAGAPFDDVLRGLRRGRTYEVDVERGRILRERTGTNGLRHPYMILVPEDYTPERSWPVRLDLHGGMGAKEWKELDGAWSPGWGPVRNQIVVLPAGWWDSMWWEWSQVENIDAILREVGRTWNVDEDRVVAFGNSDGGAALFFLAMRTPDRFAGFTGAVAPPDRLVRDQFRPDGQCHVSNLADQRFLLIYGEKDKLVPLKHLTKYMELFEANGTAIDWHVLDGQKHSLTIPAPLEQDLARFLFRTTRDPLPDRLSWATERTDRYARRSWLVIDELEEPGPDHVVDETNLLPRWGTSIQLRGPTVARQPWGRVELERDGNRVRATTRRVRRFRLLISPDEFDLAEPIRVEVDGELVHEARVEPSVATLLVWAARDEDRTKLFAAEIVIEL